MTEVPFKIFSYSLQKVQDAKGLENNKKGILSIENLSFMQFLSKELKG